MKKISKNQKEFYENYWKNRKAEGCLHTVKGARIPERLKIIRDIILKDTTFNKNKPISILDIGCGEGTFGKILKDTLNQKLLITGCDVSNTALKEASIYYDNVFQIDIDTEKIVTKIQYKQKFDYIVISEVLEHLFTPENILKQCHKYLKHDGYLITSIPNIAWYKYRIDMLKGYFPKNYLLYPGEHIQNFTLHSFYKLLKENGFYPTKIDGQFLFPNFFRPAIFFNPIFKKFPNIFGYQIVVKSKKENNS